jgi:hypothetical protein
MSKITREKCAEIIHEFEPSTEAKLAGHLGIDGMFKAKENRRNENSFFF